MQRFNLLLILQTILILGAVSLNASSIGSVIVSVDPNSTSVATGQTVSAAIDIQGLEGSAPNGPSLGAYQFLFSYNSAILGDPTVTFGDPSLGDQLALTTTPFTCVGTACGASSNFPLELGEVSFDPSSVLNAGQAASFTLATISFTALGTGTSDLSLSDVILSDENGRALTAGIVDSSVNVSSTPEPRTGILLPLAMGLAALFLRRRWSAAHA
jgi:hypothetical protein